MQFTETSLFPARQEPLIITAMLFGPSPRSARAGSAPTMMQQVQTAMDCMNAGASILHVNFEPPDIGEEASPPRDVSALLTMLRQTAPRLLLQIEGSRVGPQDRAGLGSGRELSIVESLEPKPDLITIEVLASPVEFLQPPLPGASADPHEAFTQMGRLRRNGVQPFFVLHDLGAQGHLEHLIRTGRYMGPVNQCMVAGGSGSIGCNPIDWMEFLRRAPNGSRVALQGAPAVAFPLAALAIAFGVHLRVAAFRSPHGPETDVVGQVKRAVRLARQFNRKVATCDDARRLLSVGTWYDSPEETMFVLGMLPNRQRRH